MHIDRCIVFKITAMVCVYFLENFKTKFSVPISLALKLEMPSKKPICFKALLGVSVPMPAAGDGT